MSSASRQAHWEGVYTNKGENEVSWFQESPAISLELIAETAATTASRIIDIGGGASRLVGSLVSQGPVAITIVDLSTRGWSKADGARQSTLWFAISLILLTNIPFSC
jgi:hypothetical protein